MTKKLLFALLFATRITRLVAWLNRAKITILCYHGVTNQPGDSSNDPYKLRLPLASFLTQLDYLQTHYRIISLSEFIRLRNENRQLPRGTAVLTFDDGHRNFLTVAAPILLQRGLPCTSFIVTGPEFTQVSSNLNGDWTPKDDTAYLSWNEIRDLAKVGIEFGSHTCKHLALTEIPAGEALRDLEQSFNTLTGYLGPQKVPLSYPHGRTSDGISRLSQSVGYSCGLTTVLGQNGGDSDMFALRRIVIASDDDLPTFAARVSGLTSWYSRLTEFFKGGNANEPVQECEPVISEACTLNEGF